jgi:hypothetical protein
MRDWAEREILSSLRPDVSRSEESGVRQFLRSLLASFDRDRSAIQRINTMRLELVRVSDEQLRDVAAGANGLLQFMAAAA